LNPDEKKEGGQFCSPSFFLSGRVPNSGVPNEDLALRLASE